MEYSFFILSNLSITSGAVSLALAMSSFLRLKSRLFIYYFFWLSACTLYLILDNIFYFSNAILPPYRVYYHTVTVLLLFSSYGLQSYLLPLWICEYCGIPFTRIKKMVFGGLAVTALFLVFLPFVITNNPFTQVSMTVLNRKINIWILYGIKLYVVFFIIGNIKKIERKEKRLFVAITAVYLFLFLPIGILSFFINLSFYPLLDVFNSSYLQYLIWNIIFIIFFWKYLIISTKPALTDGISDTFIGEYGITPREKEIVLLMAKGLANKQIAFELKVSRVTVKNHIYNIYKKTGAQCRIELINLLSTGSPSRNQII